MEAVPSPALFFAAARYPVTARGYIKRFRRCYAFDMGTRLKTSGTRAMIVKRDASPPSREDQQEARPR
jgi:hypothetical protein